MTGANVKPGDSVTGATVLVNGRQRTGAIVCGRPACVTGATACVTGATACVTGATPA